MEARQEFDNNTNFPNMKGWKLFGVAFKSLYNLRCDDSRRGVAAAQIETVKDHPSWPQGARCGFRRWLLLEKHHWL